MNILSKIYYAIGKRKTAIAKIYLQEGKDIIIINNKLFQNYFQNYLEKLYIIKLPFIICNIIKKYNITIYVKGGGLFAQIDAIKLGIARAICQINYNYKSILKKFLLLKRSSKIKERRKYGLKKARKASQFSKR